MSAPGPPQEVFGWAGGGLTPAKTVTPAKALTPAKAADELLVADSWLVDNGRMRGFELHRTRFTGACQAIAGAADDDVRAFLDACLAVIPATGRWFPRVECTRGAGLRLRLRIAPQLAGSAVLWPFPGPDPRKAPRVKGPDLALLGEVRGAAQQRGADEAVLCSPDGIVLEGAFSSIVWWRDDRLHLPDPDLPTLDSVTRRLVVRLAERTPIRVESERVRLPDLDGLEVWVLSALHGIRYVSGWTGVDVRPGPARYAAQWRDMLAALATPPASRKVWLRH